MKKAKSPHQKPRPCIVMALELLGIEEPTMPEGRTLAAFAIVNERLREVEPERKLERRVLIAGSRVLHAAPIERGGTLTFRELLYVVHLQAELIAHSVLLRGSVSLGDVTARADLVAGPGLFEAERLRDELADVPRVIVDPRLIRETEQNPDLRATHHTVPMELRYIRGLLREDTDGLWFGDYLKVLASELNEPSIRLEFLEEHRQQIDRRLQGSIPLGRSSRSLTWLRGYHNRVIEEIFKEGQISDAERARLRVTTRTPLLYVFPPSTEAPE